VWSAGGELVEEFGDAGVVDVAHGKSGGLVVESGEEKSVNSDTRHNVNRQKDIYMTAFSKTTFSIKTLMAFKKNV
jgi:hypothetical protein